MYKNDALLNNETERRTTQTSSAEDRAFPSTLLRDRNNFLIKFLKKIHENDEKYLS